MRMHTPRSEMSSVPCDSADPVDTKLEIQMTIRTSSPCPNLNSTGSVKCPNQVYRVNPVHCTSHKKQNEVDQHHEQTNDDNSKENHIRLEQKKSCPQLTSLVSNKIKIESQESSSKKCSGNKRVCTFMITSNQDCGRSKSVQPLKPTKSQRWPYYNENTLDQIIHRNRKEKHIIGNQMMSQKELKERYPWRVPMPKKEIRQRGVHQGDYVKSVLHKSLSNKANEKRTKDGISDNRTMDSPNKVLRYSCLSRRNNENVSESNNGLCRRYVKHIAAFTERTQKKCSIRACKLCYEVPNGKKECSNQSERSFCTIDEGVQAVTESCSKCVQTSPAKICSDLEIFDVETDIFRHTSLNGWKSPNQSLKALPESIATLNCSPTASSEVNFTVGEYENEEASYEEDSSPEIAGEIIYPPYRRGYINVQEDVSYPSNQHDVSQSGKQQGTLVSRVKHPRLLCKNIPFFTRAKSPGRLMEIGTPPGKVTKIGLVQTAESDCISPEHVPPKLAREYSGAYSNYINQQASTCELSELENEIESINDYSGVPRHTVEKRSNQTLCAQLTQDLSASPFHDAATYTLRNLSSQLQVQPHLIHLQQENFPVSSLSQHRFVKYQGLTQKEQRFYQNEPRNIIEMSCPGSIRTKEGYASPKIKNTNSPMPSPYRSPPKTVFHHNQTSKSTPTLKSIPPRSALLRSPLSRSTLNPNAIPFWAPTKRTQQQSQFHDAPYPNSHHNQQQTQLEHHFHQLPWPQNIPTKNMSNHLSNRFQTEAYTLGQCSHQNLEDCVYQLPHRYRYDNYTFCDQDEVCDSWSIPSRYDSSSPQPW